MRPEEIWGVGGANEPETEIEAKLRASLELLHMLNPEVRMRAEPLKTDTPKEVTVHTDTAFGRMIPVGFDVKDSGAREQFAGGMQRDTGDKTRFDLVFDGPMLARFAEHLTKGARKYEARNWMKAAGDEEMERFRQSAARHFVQWMAGDRTEDHAAAVMFNLNGAEYVKEKLDGGKPSVQPQA